MQRRPLRGLESKYKRAARLETGSCAATQRASATPGDSGGAIEKNLTGRCHEFPSTRARLSGSLTDAVMAPGAVAGLALGSSAV